jgi:Flp pilus assembly protein TadG
MSIVTGAAVHTGVARSPSGQALVEFAVVLPVLMMLVLGIAQFGIAFNNYIMLTDAVRAGARQLATSRGTANPCQVSAGKLAAAATTLTPANISATMTIAGVGTYSGTPPTNPSCPGQGNNMQAGSDVVVTATYHHQALFIGLFSSISNLRGVKPKIVICAVCGRAIQGL